MCDTAHATHYIYIYTGSIHCIYIITYALRTLHNDFDAPGSRRRVDVSPPSYVTNDSVVFFGLN